MDKKEVSRFLIVIRIGKKLRAPERVLQTIADVKETLVRCSTGEIQLAFNSEDTATIGLLIKSTYHPGGILAILRGTDHGPLSYWIEDPHTSFRPPQSAPLLNDDGVFVFQLGNDFASYGFSKAQMWLDRD